MCAPISVATKGSYSCPVGGNHGLLTGQIIAVIALAGALGWNFKGLVGRLFGRKSTAG